MNALTCCHPGSPCCTTPWCSMLKGRHEQDNALHLYYKLTWLQDEIEKRSSYLGKFRRTEEAKHLLDLIAMTTDEEDLFYPFAKAAMADVFDAIEKYAPQQRKGYLWNEGKNSIVVPSKPDPDGAIWENTIDNGSDNFDILLTWTEADESTFDATFTLQIENNGATETVTAQAAYDSTVEMWRITDINADLKTMHITSGDTPDVTLMTANALFKTPLTYNAGDWVEIDGNPFFATTAGNANNRDGLVAPAADWRRSVHYLLSFPSDWNSNMSEPLDTAVFEALTARIIYKWLQYAYPDEAPRYLTEYNEAISNVKQRCYTLFGHYETRRIPRIF